MTGAAPSAGAVAIRFVRVRLPLRSAHVSSHGTETTRDIVLVEHRDLDLGVSGWGECPSMSASTYPGGTTDEVWHAVGSIGAIGSGPTPPTLRAALLDAALDARLRSGGTSLFEHLRHRLTGATPGDPVVELGVDTCRVVAAAPADRHDVLRRIVAGDDEPAPSMVKVKVDGPELDALAEARVVVGDDVALAADANGTFGRPGDLPGGAAQLASIGLRYLEQPLPPGVACPVDEWPSPIAFDESVTSIRSADRILRAGHGTRVVLSVKPARVGGVEDAATIIERCARVGAGWFVGGMVETGIGRATALALAAAAGAAAPDGSAPLGGGLPCDLGPSARYFDVDVTDPIVADATGRLLVPAGPGIGRTPDPSLLARFLVDEASVRIG